MRDEERVGDGAADGAAEGAGAQAGATPAWRGRSSTAAAAALR